MANLYNKNIGINYKGILNLDSTINTPLDTTLRSITDGMGVASVLSLSTSAFKMTSLTNNGSTVGSIFNSTQKVIDINDRGTISATAFNSPNNVYRLGFSGSFDAGSLQLYAEGNANGVFFAGKINTENYIYNNLLIGTSSSAIIKLGGTTNAFPSIKRNGSAIDFRLADDSGACDITANRFLLNSAVYLTSVVTLGVGISSGINTLFNNGASWIDDSANMPLKIPYKNGVRFCGGNLYSVTIGADAVANTSAILDIISTTKGFLPPRMTTTQINAIATPAEGLQIYNTTINHMCFYMNGTWQKINHSPM